MVRLYREWLTVPGVTRGADDRVRARTAVELAMTAVPPGTDGYLRTWDGVDLLDVSVTDERITITLSGPGRTAFPEDTERVTVQQLVWTAQAAVGRGTIPVRFELADGSDAMFGTQPVDRTYNRPASRDLYHEDLAPIWVTAPTRGQVLPAGRRSPSGARRASSRRPCRGSCSATATSSTRGSSRPRWAHPVAAPTRSGSAPWHPGRTPCGSSS